jgi:hypothetical protein
MMNIYKLRVSQACLADGSVQMVLAALIVLSATPAAVAANCVEQPKLQADQVGHWYYYRPSSLNHRKCWYLHQQQQPSTESSTAESKPAVEGDTSLSSFLSSLFDARQAGVSSAVTASAPSAEPVAVKKSTSERRWLLRAKQVRLSQVHQPELERGHQQYQFDSAQREALFESFLRWAAREGQAAFRGDAAGPSEAP